MAQGWVSIHRKLQESWLWEDKPFSKGQAWIDLIMMVNHEAKKTMIDGNLVHVKRGQRITSLRKLADRWGWDKNKVSKFLKILQDDEKIILENSTKNTTFTIVNYEIYQGQNKGEESPVKVNLRLPDSNDDGSYGKKPKKRDKEETGKSIDKTSLSGYDNPQNGTVKGQLRDSEGTIKGTNNNENNVNNDNKNIYMSDSKEYRLASYLFRYMRKNNEKVKEPNFKSWCEGFDKILRIDKRDAEEVKDIIKFSQKHEFWYKNILSPTSIRKQYDKLVLEMKDKNKVQSSNYSNKKPNRRSFNDFEQRTYDFDDLEKKLLGWDD